MLYSKTLSQKKISKILANGEKFVDISTLLRHVVGALTIAPRPGREPRRNTPCLPQLPASWVPSFMSLAYLSPSLCACGTSHQRNVRQGKHLFRKMLHSVTSPECLAGNESLVHTPAAGGQEMEPFAQYIFSFHELVLVEVCQLLS